MDSVAVFPPLWRATDANNVPVPGAMIKFFQAGTTTPLTVYGDINLANPIGTVITCDASGAPQNGANADTLIYVGTAAYKVAIYDQNTVLVPGKSYDYVKGAVSTATSTPLWTVPVVSVAASRTMVTTDFGEALNCDTSLATISYPLLPAAAAGNGTTVTLRKLSPSNSLVITANGSEQIDGSGTVTLTVANSSITLVSNGVAWYSIAANSVAGGSGSSGLPVINPITYGGIGNGSADDTAAMTAAINAFNTSGILYIPPGIWRYSALPVITRSGGLIMGAGRQSILQHISTTGNSLAFAGVQNTIVRDVWIFPGIAKTAGYGVAFTASCYKCRLENVRIDYEYNGILIQSSTNIILDTEVRYMRGSYGVYFTGTLGAGSYGLDILRHEADNPYPLQTPTAANAKAYATSTAYASGDIVIGGSFLWQAMVGGVTAGSAPSWLPSTASASAMFTTSLTDGTVQWRAVCQSDLTHLACGDYAYSVTSARCALLNGMRGLYQFSESSTANISKWLQMHDLEIDHTYYSNIILNRGSGFVATNSWLGSSLTGNGLQIDSTYSGDASVSATRISGCAQHGILNNGAPDVGLFGNRIGANSALSSGVYHGVIVNASANCAVAGNRSGAITAQGGNNQGYGVFVTGACPGLLVKDNSTQGNVTGTVFNGSTGTPQDTTGNI